MRERFGNFVFVPTALAYFRPRETLKSFAQQYYLYAAGDGHAGIFARLHFVRYFTYLIAVPLGLYAALTVSPAIWMLGVLAELAYLRRPLIRANRLWGSLSPMQCSNVILLLPIIRLVGDMAKMLGYPVGLWKKLTKGKK